MNFPNHVATVVEFLEAYRKEQDLELRSKLSVRFTQYLILACSAKMKARASHWAILGIITQLALVPYGVLSELKVQSSTDPDTRLARNILTLEKEEDLGAVLAFHKPNYAGGAPLTIPNLLRACKDKKPLFTQDTAIEYHHLLVASLILYETKLHDYEREVDVDKKSKLNAQLAMAGALLRVILFSKAFDCYIITVTHAGPGSPPFLLYPTSNDVKSYINYAKKTFGTTFGEEKDEEQAGADPDEEASYAAGDTTNEMDHLIPPSGVSDAANLRKFVHSSLKLLVKYHTAQGVLESYCRGLPAGEEVKISIRMVEVTPREENMPDWREIKTVIRSVLKSPEKSEDAIQYIQEAVETANTERRDPQSPIFHMFRFIIADQPQPLSYTVHCEAALVAFAEATVDKNQPLDELQSIQLVHPLFGWSDMLISQFFS
jgi:hypothetical protein